MFEKKDPLKLSEELADKLGQDLENELSGKKEPVPSPLKETKKGDANIYDQAAEQLGGKIHEGTESKKELDIYQQSAEQMMGQELAAKQREVARESELEKVREKIKDIAAGSDKSKRRPKTAKKPKEIQEQLPEEMEFAVRDEKRKAEAQKESEKIKAERLRQKKREDEALYEQLRKEKNPSPEVVEVAHYGERRGEILEKSREHILEDARVNFARIDLNTQNTFKKIKKLHAEKILDSIKAEDAETIAIAKGANEKMEKHGIISMEGARRILSDKETQSISDYKEIIKRKGKFETYLRIEGVDDEETEKMYKDALEYEKAKAEYREALKNYRVKNYETALDEIEMSHLPDEQKQEMLRQKMEEIVKITVVAEANNLYDAKTRIGLEAKGDASFAEKAWKTAGKATEWYRKLPLKYKFMVSGGLLAGGVVAGAAGGATGAALAAGVVTGRWFQRIFGGAATAVGLEGLIKRSQEKQAEKKTFKEFGDKLSELIKNNDKSLDERLLTLEGKKKNEKTRRYILAGAAGVVVASGLLGRAIRWGMEETGVGKPIKETVSGWFEHKPPSGPSPELAVSHGPGYVPTEEYLAYEPPAGPEYPVYEAPPDQEYLVYESPPDEEFSAYEVIKGGPEIAGRADSVWKIIGRQLSDRYGEKFTGLDEARKTYVIDALKDRVAADPEKFGLTNVDQIQAGKTYDLLPGSKVEIDNVFEGAAEQKQAALNSIIEHNRILEEWVKMHPGEQLTSDKSDEILFGKQGVSVIETEGGETVAEREPVSGSVIEKVAEENQGEELPGEEVKAVGVEQKTETASQVAEHVKETAQALGFSEAEYKAIENLKVGKLLEQIPSKEQAWENWRIKGWRGFDLPHDGFYDNREFSRHIKLAEFIRSFKPGSGILQTTIEQFLKTIGKI